jgi:hypothetical protein
MGLKERPPMKKEITPKCKGLKRKRPLIKKEETPKCKGLKRKSSGKKRANTKMQGAQKRDLR